jgi:hypothetical protein
MAEWLKGFFTAKRLFTPENLGCATYATQKKKLETIRSSYETFEWGDLPPKQRDIIISYHLLIHSTHKNKTTKKAMPQGSDTIDPKPCDALMALL